MCRAWRDALVSQPFLWSFIDGSRPSLIPCFLDRSKNAHLDVYINSCRVKEVIAYINPHIDRLRSIHIELGLGGDSQFLALRYLNAAPKLRRLNIRCRRGLNPGFTPGIVEPISSIHHLQLSGMQVTPQLVQLRHLTFISLDVSGGTLRAPLDLLSRNPLLKAIHLRGTPDRDFIEDSRHPPGSIHLPHLEVLLSELTPLAHLEALSPPRGARIFSGFVTRQSSDYPREFSSASFPIPTSFSNLRDLQKLCLVYREVAYVKLEGPDGSITCRTCPDSPFAVENFSGVPLEGVRDATFELTSRDRSPPATSQPLVSRIVCGITQLQKLELSCCDAEQVEYLLLVLHSINVCRDLKFLVLSHCVEVHGRMRRLVTMTESRKAAGMGLDTVRIVRSNAELYKDTFKQEDVRRLERAIGTFEYVQAEQGRAERSSLRFDPEIGISQPSLFL